MSGVRLEIGRLGRIGSIVLDSDDILGIDRCGDGAHAVILTVRYRKEYLEDEAGAFRWGAGYNDLHLMLTSRQVREAVEQIRSHSSFCNGEEEAGCFDFGKVEFPPAGCLRCRLTEMCRRSGGGDHRKVIPEPKEVFDNDSFILQP